MPSEVLVPGLAAIVLLIIATLSIVGVIGASMSMAVNSIRESYESSYKRSSRITIQQVNASYSGKSLEVNLTVLNNGPYPIYKFEACDLIIEYFSLSGSLKSLRLSYGSNWTVEKVFLIESYGLSFTEHPLIDTNEAGLIRANAIVGDLDAAKPLKIVFTTHYGSRDSKWVAVNA
jgi:archaellum component FlaF (FlaF/FlaG flagellin family)